MTNSETYNELKTFSGNIIGCIEAIKKENPELYHDVLSRVSNVVRLHLAIKELDFNQTGIEMERDYASSTGN